MKNFFTLTLCALTLSLTAQTPPYTILTTTDDAAPGVVVMSPVQNANQIYLCALNEDAEMILSAHSPIRGFIFEPWGDDEFVFYDYSIRKWVTVDQNLTPTDTLGLSIIPETDYHDVHRFEDGSYMFVVSELVIMDLSSFGGVEDAEVIQPWLIHMDVEENILREWHGLDHIPVNVANNLSFQLVDYLHWNAFDIDSQGGLLMSFRNISTIARLNPIDWSVDWKLGGSGNDFQIDDPEWGGFLNQHDVNDIGGNRILLFDNNYSSENQPGYSRVVEYELDTVAMTATRGWSYSHPDEIYSPAQGSVERLENGNTLIAWGNANTSQGLGTLVTEINDQGDIVWEIQLGEYFTVYRARKVPSSEIQGCGDINALNYDTGVLVDDGSCYFGVDEDGDGMLDSEGDCDDTDASIYLGAPEIPNDGVDQNCDGSDFIFIPGCTDSTASNYNLEATDDDGSCIYTGCMDSAACNYNPDAIEDDGNCDYSCCPGPGCCYEGTYWDTEAQKCLVNDTYCSWQPDSNADGLVGVTDLLDFLSVFGDTDYDEDGVFDSVDDCVDTAACNYQANPTEPCYYIDVLGVCGGGCEADEDDDSICDDIDDCIGVIDECGVCNGPGATEVVIDNITILYDSVYLPQLEEWYVYEFGADTTFSFTCEPVFNSCGDDINHEGYDYSTVQIGEQCWFSENCRYLPAVSPSSASSETDPYYYVYAYEGSDVSAAIATDNYETYGVLYNWPAVMTEGICPSGWHIPSDGEFTELTDFLGGEGVAGGKMKEAGYDHWNSPNTGATNSSGWTGLPGGYRYSGGFSSSGYNGLWWSASESGSYSWSRRLDVNDDSVYRVNDYRVFGFSARCVRD